MAKPACGKKRVGDGNAIGERIVIQPVDSPDRKRPRIEDNLPAIERLTIRVRGSLPGVEYVEYFRFESERFGIRGIESHRVVDPHVERLGCKRLRAAVGPFSG